jgi:hypothetical protein
MERDNKMMYFAIAGSGCLFLCVIALVVYFLFFFNKAAANNMTNSPSTSSISSQNNYSSNKNNEIGLKADKNKWKCVYKPEKKELFCADKKASTSNISSGSSLSTFNCIETDDSWKCGYTMDVKDVKEFREISISHS